MRNQKSSLRRQLGVTAIEYALLAAAIATLMLGVIGQGSPLEEAIKGKFTDIAAAIKSTDTE